MAVRGHRRHVALLLALVALLIVAIVAFDQRIDTRDYHLTSTKLTAPVRIVLLTDLHSYIHGPDQQALVAAIAAARPDVVVMSGDIADDEEPHRGTEILLQHLAGRYPLYYVTGNHEWWSLEVDTIKAMFRRAGVIVLAGDCVTQPIREQRVRLCGIDDPEVGRDEFAAQITATGTPTEDFSVLLAHRPERIAQYLPSGHDLIVSGHTHGGQFRIPYLMNGLFAPNQGFFPRLGGGRYDYGETALIVSRGLVSGRPRIFNRPEVVAIEIGPR